MFGCVVTKLIPVRVSPLLSVSMSSLRKPIAAVAQMRVTSDLEANLGQAAELVTEAKRRGADMVFLPEACDFIGENRKQTLDLAQTLDGSTVTRFRKLASDNGVWLSLGGVHSLREVGAERTTNSHLVISDEGVVVASYDKAHLFDVEIPGSVSLCESAYVDPGQRVTPPLDTPLGKLGLGVCYDLRFAEFSQSLARAGAEVLSFPSAFTIKTGMAHWEPLLRARAIETQCYVIAAAQTGQHNEKRSSYGHSLIVDPWGTVIAQAGEGVGVATAPIDLDYLASVRRNMPVQQHRRPELYGHVRIQNDKTELPGDDFVFNFGPVTVPGPAIFLQSPLAVAFVNKKPVVEGHVLVSSLRSVPQLSDLNPEEAADLFKLVQRVDTFVQSFYKVNSTTISIQNGELAGQSIPHVHVHILPRRDGDFRENDDVYKELQSHDKQTSGWRKEEEMIAEAKIFRDYLES